MLLKTPASITILRGLLRAGPCVDVPVATVVPEDMVVPFVRIERVGGRPLNAVTDAPRFVIHVYAADGIDAEARALDILDHLEHGPWRSTDTESGHRLMGWRTETIMPLPDPDRPSLHRWQVMGALHISRLTSRTNL